MLTAASTLVPTTAFADHNRGQLHESATGGSNYGHGAGPDGTEWRFDVRWGEGADANCGPDATGDGWVCDPHIPNVFEYNPDYFSTQVHEYEGRLLVHAPRVLLRATDGDLAQACVRVDGPQTAGGLLEVDVSDFPGVEPVADVQPGLDPHDADSPCTLQVFHLDNPVTVDVHRSGTGEIPASLCVRLASSSLTATLGATGEPSTTPPISFTPDS